MQILAHNPEITTYSTDEGHFITGFLVGTKPNEAKWKVNNKTIHNIVQKFVGKDFAIIPQLLNTPLSQGGGGHYFGQDTKEDLLKGYADNSHGKYVKVKGPYSYNDGTDDCYYNFDIKLRDSKAASILLEYGAQTWIPFSHSPHIWPLAGPDDDIYDWEPIGGALVIKGAYGPQAVISKLCKGTAAQCEKSLGASAYTAAAQISNALNNFDGTQTVTVNIPTPCEQKDAEIAQIISSLVSKTASTQIYMPENKEATPPVVTNLTTPTEVAKPNAVVETNPQHAISNAPKIVTVEEYAASEKEKAELKKQVTQLLNDKKNNELTSVLIDFAQVSDDKRKKDFVEKWFKKEVDVNILREFYNDIKAEIAERRKKASESGEEVEKEDEGEKPLKARGKAASLPKEPELPKEDTSRAASVPAVNKIKEIHEFMLSGGRA